MLRVPSRIDGPVAVIGDVHGQTDKLRRIIGQLARLPGVEHRWFVFIGDLVDRGPDPAGTVQLYCDLAKQHSRVTWVCGNHELAMAGSLGLLPLPDYVSFAQPWVDYYLSETTFESYGAPHGDLDALREALPESHAELLAGLPWMVEHSDFVFVHAGLDRNLPFDTQVRILRERDFSVSQPPWLYSRDFVLMGPPEDCPVPVVVGHVPMPSVHFENRVIATDTGSGHDGPLSCVLLPEMQVLSSEDDVAVPLQPHSRSGGKRSWWRRW